MAMAENWVLAARPWKAKASWIAQMWGVPSAREPLSSSATIAAS